MCEQRRPGKAEQILALASALAVTWSMMPPQERYWAQLRLLSLARRVSASLARAEGRKGMAAELAGHDPLPRYGVALLASRARDKLDKALEGMRP